MMRAGGWLGLLMFIGIPAVAEASAETPRVGLLLPARQAAGAEVTADQLLDYTFGNAPTDWEPHGGTWAISSRYACEPEWSFFGGRSRGVCALWNKRRFGGDVAIEIYAAFMHGLPWADEQWHYVPSDLNINLFSRPGDLASGYSFIYSGRGGSTTLIRRGQRVLAETHAPQALLPAFSDHNPLFQPDEAGRQFGEFHRKWWRLEARRTGSRLTFSVDGQVVLTADDSDPIDAGQIALWTLGSGFVVARARIAYDHELPPAQAPWVVRQAAPLP